MNFKTQKDKLFRLENNLLNIRAQYKKDSNVQINQQLINYSLVENKNKDMKDLFSSVDMDMVGLTYPDIDFDNIKYNLVFKNLTISLIDFLEKLQAKIIFLEKEINVTKLYTFYTTRTLFLQKYRIDYDDSNITELHNIINWLVIHKSTQLKGIASDKFLACKYVKMKLNRDLCQHRIKVYDNIEEINFEELIKKGNIVFKISNGCHDLVYIRKNRTYNIELIKQKVKYYYNREYSLKVPEFFHLYSKKRIIVENIFTPFSDLYEFKFFIVNQNIKFIQLLFCLNNKQYQNFYNKNYELLLFSEVHNFTIFSTFKKDILDQLEEFAIKLSEDFPNFIRVDLYIFNNTIYLSELTFDSFSGMPMKRKEEIIIATGKEWKLIE